MPHHDVKFLQISDTHLFETQGDTLIGVDTGASLQAVAALARKEQNVTGILATGDLSQDGSLDSYRHFAQLLGVINAPVYWVPGNHDNPDFFHIQENFPLSSRSVIEAGNWRIILLDSVLVGKDSGRLARSELEYLEQQVLDDGRHTLLVMHHHPLQCGSAWLDTMVLENAEEFLNLIARMPSVKAVVNGHIHQARQQDVAGVSFISSPSTCFQFTPDTDEFSLDKRLPGYRRLILRHDGTIDTEVVRLKEFDLKLEPAVVGY